jgi:hypothetical protein
MGKDISTLHLKNCQIKSREAFRSTCAAIDELEKVTFIRSGSIKFANVFVCPDIDLIEFYESSDPTERLIAGLAIQIHCKRYGRFADKRYKKIINGK